MRAFTIAACLVLAAAAVPTLGAESPPTVQSEFAVSPLESSATYGSHWTGHYPIPVDCRMIVVLDEETIRIVPNRRTVREPDSLCEKLPVLQGTVAGIRDRDDDGVMDVFDVKSDEIACLVADQSTWTGRFERGVAGESPARLEISGWTGMGCVADGYELTYVLVGYPATPPKRATTNE